MNFYENPFEGKMLLGLNNHIKNKYQINNIIQQIKRLIELIDKDNYQYYLGTSSIINFTITRLENIYNNNHTRIVEFIKIGEFYTLQRTLYYMDQLTQYFNNKQPKINYLNHEPNGTIIYLLVVKNN